MKHGFVKIATAVPALSTGDPIHNATSIIDAIDMCKNEAEIILFPELCLTTSSCESLFHHPLLAKECEKVLSRIAKETKDCNAIIAIGTPILHNSALYNCTAVMHNGEIICLVPKATSDRWFSGSNSLDEDDAATLCNKTVPFLKNGIIRTESFTFGIEIGNDAEAPLPPGAKAAMAGAHIILNPTASAEKAGRHACLRERIKQQSKRYECIYVYAESGWGESTSKAVYSGYCAIAECGSIIAESERFRTSTGITITEADAEKATNRRIGNSNFSGKEASNSLKIHTSTITDSTFRRRFSPTPFIPEKSESCMRYEEIFSIQATALARRIAHTHADTAIIGVSGGLDSTLALLVTVKAFDILGRKRESIIAITMPGFGTTGRTYNNALALMSRLGVTQKEISIKEACLQHFKDIEHDAALHDVTYENSQARERTQILMDIANKHNGLVIGTGDMSELALGWATYNGDHMSMYGVNASVPKTLMQHIVRWVAESNENIEIRETLLDILDTPISPELTPANDNGTIKQKTEDLVGPYELHDFFLYHFMRNRFSPEKILFMAQNAFEGTYNDETIKKWLKTFVRRFFVQQFKRSCMPDSPKTGSCSFSDGEKWSMTADNNHRIWSDNLN